MGVFFEEIIKVGRIVKAQAISYFRHIPIGTSKQFFSLLDNPIGDMHSGGFTGNGSNGTVKVIDMDGKLMRKLTRRFQFQVLPG